MIDYSTFALSTGGKEEWRYKLTAARTPPAMWEASMDNSGCKTAWISPDKKIPKIRAKPLRTEPACFVTNPTMIPPALFVAMGINVDGVQPCQKPCWTMLCPSGDRARLNARRSILAAHSSILKRYGLRPPPTACKFFCDNAPAKPEMKLAKRSGATPCVNRSVLIGCGLVDLATRDVDAFNSGRISTTPSMTRADSSSRSKAKICTFL